MVTWLSASFNLETGFVTGQATFYVFVCISSLQIFRSEMQGVPIDPTTKDFWEQFSKVSAPDHHVAGNEQVSGNDQVAGNEPHRQL